MITQGDPPPRLVIAAPRMGLWSETFIASHVQRLLGVEAVITDGVLPSRVHEGPLLLRRSLVGRMLDHAEARLRRMDMDSLLRSRIASLLRRHRIEVVLAEYGTCADALLAPCAQAGVPLVAHFHGFDAYNSATLNGTGNYSRLFDQAAALVVVSRAMEQQLLSLGAAPEKVVRNCYGIDVDHFVPGKPDQAPPHFLAVGRFVEKKAPHITLGAFEQVLEEVPEARLIMVGQGPLWEECAERVNNGVLAGHVDLPGILDPEQVAAMMRRARAFVQHSVQAVNGDCEGTPLAVLEAMASALPVIATRHAGIADVVAHGEDGLLCAEHDQAAMAAHMLQVARDPAMAARLGSAGRAKAERQLRVQDSIAKLQAILLKAAKENA